MSSDLERMERWMQAVFTHPDGAEAGLQSAEAQKCIPTSIEALDELVLPSKSLTAEERLSIYANMYYWRLIDILVDEFPTVHHLLGPEQFTVVVKDYLERHPSTSYTLNHLSSRFAGYIEEEVRDLPHREFIAAVARVERAMEDVFDESYAEPVTIDDLGSLSVEGLGDIHLQIIPALRLLELDYPVNNYITAVREDRHMDIPLPAKTYIAVYRSNYKPWRVDLEPQRYALLSSLKQGKSLREALESCMSVSDTDGLACSLENWFRDWAADGLFCGIKITAGE
ncbi:MAG: DNA-binding domain-containing protein [Pseudomonadota bacterium]